HVSDLSLPGGIDAIRRRRVPPGCLLFHFDHPHRSGGGDCSHGPSLPRPGVEYAGGKAPQNRPVDNAPVALCQHYRRAGLSDDLSLLLKGEVFRRSPPSLRMADARRVASGFLLSKSSLRLKTIFLLNIIFR